MPVDSHSHDLFLLMINLSQMKDVDRIKILFIESLESFWPGIYFSISKDKDAFAEKKSVPIATSKNSFGYLMLKEKTSVLDEIDIALIANCACMLALILENRKQDKLLAEEREYLSVLVEERTKELEEKNEELEEIISERLKVEMDLQEKNTEIAAQNEEYVELNNELIQAKEKAEQSDQLKSTFLAVMSHEVRTPLNSILGYTNLVLEDDLSDKHRNFLESVRRSGELLLTIISDILDLSVIEADKLTLKKEPFPLGRLLQCVEAHAKCLIANNKKDILFSVNRSDQISEMLSGDEMRLQQVLNNLINNAIKFTDKGSVGLSVSLKQDKLEFMVTDTGIGIPEEKKDEIFNVFTQIDMSNTRKYGGVGLGLSISKKLVCLMNGDIHLEAQKGKQSGTTIVVSLPYLPVATKEPQQHTRPVKQKPDTVKRKTILVVDDDAMGSLLVQRILEKARYQVILVKNGQEAIDSYKKRDDIGLILMDLQMPVLDGFRATIRIRELENERDDSVAIIALTAAAMKEDQEKSLKVGCDDYISKPFESPVLLEKISKAINKRK